MIERFTTTLQYRDSNGEFHEESRDADTANAASIDKAEALAYVSSNGFSLISCETTSVWP